MFEKLARGRMSDEMTAIMARIATSNSKRENMDIVSEFAKLVDRVIEQEKKTAGLTPSEPDKAISATIKFKADECAKMDKTFRKEFAEGGYVARIIKRPSATKRVKTFVYEIRYRRNGYFIEVSSTDIQEAKRKFIAATLPENIDDYTAQGKKSGLNLFREVAAEWWEYKRSTVAELTHKRYWQYYKKHVHPLLGDKPIKNIRTLDIDRALQGKGGRLREDLYTVFNSIFKYALACGMIAHDPMLLVRFVKSERQNRRALTSEEQAYFMERVQLPEYAAYKRELLILFYFGLRPCELQDTRFENGFLIARNAKRKGGKIEYKKIPVHEQACQKIDVTAPIDGVHNPEVLNRVFKRIMGGGELTQYSLRHTFATVCQMYVRPDIVDIWLGDSPQRLVGRVYTHFPDEFMREQMQGVKFGGYNG